jgi:hypothetical protein
MSLSKLRLRSHNMFSLDFSTGKTWKVSQKIAKSRGVRPGKGPTVKAVQLQQQWKLGFGCSFAGQQMASAMGFRSDLVPEGQVAVLELPAFAHMFLGRVAPVLIVYNPKDGTAVSRTFTHLILDPTLEKLLDQLQPDERHIVIQDGGEAGILKPVQDVEWQDKMRTARRSVGKLPVNSTGTLQLADLLRLFHLVKDPAAVIEKLSLAEWTAMVEETQEMIGDFFDPYFKEKNKRTVFIEAVAAFFFAILPSLSAFEIQRNARKLMSVEAIMFQCNPPPSDWTMANINAALPALVRKQVAQGRLSAESMDNPLRDPDGTSERLADNDPGNLRGDLFVDLTHDATYQRAYNKTLAKKLGKKQQASTKAEKKQRRALKAAESEIRKRDAAKKSKPSTAFGTVWE